MPQAYSWKVFGAAIFALTMLCARPSGAQAVLDPGPGGDDEAIESDLPAPAQPASVLQPPRDLSRAFLGVTFDPSVKDAAVAMSVGAGSPADQAGVKAGDTIVSLNGRPMRTYDDVLRTIAELKPGDVLDIEASRRVNVRARAVLDGQPLDGQHTAGYRPAAEALPAPVVIRSEPRINSKPMYQTAPRQGYNTPQNRNTTTNRESNSNRTSNSSNSNRDDNRRGGLLFRRGR
jgi:membrane-associated protease RseP (regulator of RpoE activity)